MEMPGIEPGAFHMQSERSTTEPHPLHNLQDFHMQIEDGTTEQHPLYREERRVGSYRKSK